MDLRIDPMNVAIPVSLIGEDERGQLRFTLYIQLSDGFLSKEHLHSAIQASMHAATTRVVHQCITSCMLVLAARRSTV